LIEKLNTLREKSLCTKLKVSALLVNRDGIIFGEGVNYSDDKKVCLNEISDSENVNKDNNAKIVHAEIACIESIQVTDDLSDKILYVSHSPCISCSKVIVESGIKQVAYLTPFKNFDGIRYLLDNDVKVEELKEDFYTNNKVKVTKDITILKKMDSDVIHKSGLITDTNTANTIEEICEVVASVQFKKGDKVLVQMQGSLWLDNEMKYFLVKNQDIFLHIKEDNAD